MDGEKADAKARGEYLKWVKEHERIKVCSSCRWQHGCETCSYEHALRYVVRHRQPAKWWLRRRGEVLRAKVIDVIFLQKMNYGSLSDSHRGRTF